MIWISFHKESQLDEFLDSIDQLIAKELNLLTESDKPFFYDYWLHRLNLGESYLLKENNKVIGFLNYFPMTNKHWERPVDNFLFIDPDFKDPIELPVEIQGNLELTTNMHFSEAELLGEYKHKIFTHTYVRKIDTIIQPKNQSFQYMPMNSHHLSEILGFYDHGFQDNTSVGDVKMLKHEIERIVNKHSGWAYVMIDPKTEKVAGFASYVKQILPMYGTPAAFVSDIVIVPEFRGKGFAESLQTYAYNELQYHNIQWVFGSIRPTNLASIKQAEKLSRIPLMKSMNILTNLAHEMPKAI